MLDDFREWLSDNLRYILLGLAILAALLIIFFVVRFAAGAFSSEDKDTDKKTEQTQDSENADSQEKEEEQETDENALLKNAYPEVNDLIESFYTAWGQKDVAKMKELTDSFSATDEAKVTNASYIEGYENIQVYIKNGLDDSSYVVFVVYDLKFQNISTPAPGLAQLYVIKEESGNYKIHNNNEDAEIQECIEKTRQEEDVIALTEQIQKAFDEAVASDEALKTFEEELGASANTASMADNGSMLTAKEDCNVRADANTSSEILGRLTAGQQVKKIDNSTDNWIKVEYNGAEAYIYGDLLQ